MRNLKATILAGLFLALSNHAAANSTLKDADDTTPTMERGAQVYMQRCTLCHGTQGMGEGAIPLKLKSYPNTNLSVVRKAKTEEEIFNAIAMGGMLDNIGEFMPPLGNELTWTDIQSVTLFVLGLRKDAASAIAMLKANTPEQTLNSRVGRDIFEARCILCHGKNGEGDGRMARVIKTPPPFNLLKSVMPKEYLSLIIKEGGEKIGRSPQMPPWGDQLTDAEITHLVDYVFDLRNL